MKKIFLFLVLTICTGNFLFAQSQNVGIGTSIPAYKLDVTGAIRSSSDTYVGGYLGVGTLAPNYKLQVNNGPIAVFNTTDTKSWLFNYTSVDNYFYLAEATGTGSPVPRIVVANGGNVGIGTTIPIFKLDVNGNANVETNLYVGGITSIGGNLTVNNGKGIVRSWNGSQIKYYTQESSVHAILPAFGTSVEGTLAWPTGIFTTAPQVLVGDITSIGGTVGTLFRVQLIPYDATATNCHFRLINTSNAAVDYNITWNIVLLGQ